MGDLNLSFCARDSSKDVAGHILKATSWLTLKYFVVRVAALFTSETCFFWKKTKPAFMSALEIVKLFFFEHSFIPG